MKMAGLRIGANFHPNMSRLPPDFNIVEERTILLESAVTVKHESKNSSL